MAKMRTLEDIVKECLDMNNDILAIRRFERKEQSDGGILYSTGAQEEPRFGRVLAAGPGNLRVIPGDSGAHIHSDIAGLDGLRDPMHCKVGDIVIMPAIPLDHMQIIDGKKGSEVYFCSDSKIVAVFHDDEKVAA